LFLVVGCNRDKGFKSNFAQRRQTDRENECKLGSKEGNSSLNHHESVQKGRVETAFVVHGGKKKNRRTFTINTIK
jgi:hypothetical protein